MKTIKILNQLILIGKGSNDKRKNNNNKK